MIYISGAITGTKGYTERFHTAEKRLTEAGYEVVNPARINANLPSATPYEGYMRVSLALLGLCDEIYLLKGWENSKGARLEQQYAVTMGLKIIYEEEWEKEERKSLSEIAEILLNPTNGFPSLGAEFFSSEEQKNIFIGLLSFILRGTWNV